MPHRITLDKIAKLANVSKATVSYVLNGHEKTYRISEETANRIREIARDLEYIPDKTASLFRKGRHHLIAIIAPHVADFYAGLVSSIEEEAEKRDYQILLGSTFDNIDREKKYLTTLISRRVEGIIILPIDIHQPHIRLLEKRHIPTIFFRRRADSELAKLFMTFNDFEVGHIAAAHLIGCGCKRIMFVSAPIFIQWDYLKIIHEARFSGFMKGGANVSSVTFYERPVIMEIGAPQVIEDFLHVFHAFKPDGLVCLSDEIAAQTLKILQQHKIAVPQQVRLIGCDDSIIASYTSPTLSTLRLPKKQLGELMVQALFHMIDGERQDMGEVLLPPQLVIRESTG